MASLPNASRSFIAANPHLSHLFSRGSAGPELERAAGDAALEPPQAEAGDTGKLSIRIESVRRRLIDPDNLAEKYHVDALRYAGAIPGDAANQIHLETTQRKCAKGEEPHTEITISQIK